VKLFATHDWAVGLVTQAEESARGLEIVGKVSQTAKGDEALTLAKDGVWGSLSVGFEAEEWSYTTVDEQTIRLITRAKLWEISMCPWGRDPAALVEEVYRRQPSAMSHTQRNSVAIIAHMERLTAQYTSHRRPETIPEPPRPLIPDYAEWPASLRPELITRRMQGIVTQEKAERSYQEARHAHRMALAGWDQARRERGY
jgi:HK97 family phage prohead protease